VVVVGEGTADIAEAVEEVEAEAVEAQEQSVTV
jgi:hypothetical protein